MEADDEPVSPISRQERDRGEIHECMKFSTDFRRLIWPVIRTAQRNEKGGRENRQGDLLRLLRDTTKILAPAEGVKRQLLPVLKLHVVLIPKNVLYVVG